MTLDEAQRSCPIIVGNGTLVKGGGVSIDGFRCVLRMNKFSLEGWKSDAGTRTDIVAACLKPDCACTCISDAMRAGQLWWTTTKENCDANPTYRDFVKDFTGLEVFMFDQMEFRAEAAKLQHLEWRETKRTETRLSTGFLTIQFALRIFPKVVLTGFDWGQTGHYYDSAHVHCAKHCWEWEREFILFQHAKVEVLFLADLLNR